MYIVIFLCIYILLCLCIYIHIICLHLSITKSKSIAHHIFSTRPEEKNSYNIKYLSLLDSFGGNKKAFSLCSLTGLILCPENHMVPVRALPLISTAQAFFLERVSFFFLSLDFERYKKLSIKKKTVELKIRRVDFFLQII